MTMFILIAVINIISVIATRKISAMIEKVADAVEDVNVVVEEIVTNVDESNNDLESNVVLVDTVCDEINIEVVVNAEEEAREAEVVCLAEAAWRTALDEEIRIANDEEAVSGDLCYREWIAANFAVEVTDLHPFFEAYVHLYPTMPADRETLEKVAYKIIAGTDEFVLVNNFDRATFKEVRRLWEQGYSIQIMMDLDYGDPCIIVGGVSPDDINWYNTYKFSLIALWVEQVLEKLPDLLDLVKKAESLEGDVQVRYYRDEILPEMFCEIDPVRCFVVCPNCGYTEEVEHPNRNVPTEYEMGEQGIIAKSMCKCSECRTDEIRLNNVSMTVLHGLWAYFTEDSSCKGIVDRIQKFVEGHDSFEFCASQLGHPVGGFGVCLENTEIIAAFKGDIHSIIGRLGRRVPKDINVGINLALTSLAEIEAEINNPSNRYMEFFAKGGTIKYFWLDKKFAIQNPNFVRTITEEAEQLNVPVMVNIKDGKMIDLREWHTAMLTKGFNELINHVNILCSVDDETWSHERGAVRYYLFNLLLSWVEKKYAPNNREAVILCGLPGAGKSYAIRQQQFNGVCVDSDVIKWLLPEFDGGCPKAVSKESRVLSTWVNSYLLTQGKNLVFQTLGNDEDKMRGIIDALKANGYSYRIVMVDTDPFICYKRMLARKRSFDNVTFATSLNWQKEIKRIVTLFGGEII